MRTVFKYLAISIPCFVLGIYLGGVGFLAYNITPSQCSTPTYVFEATWPLWMASKYVQITDNSFVGQIRLAAVEWSLEQCRK